MSESYEKLAKTFVEWEWYGAQNCKRKIVCLWFANHWITGSSKYKQPIIWSTQKMLLTALLYKLLFGYLHILNLLLTKYRSIPELKCLLYFGHCLAFLRVEAQLLKEDVTHIRRGLITNGSTSRVFFFEVHLKPIWNAFEIYLKHSFFKLFKGVSNTFEMCLKCISNAVFKCICVKFP